MNDCLYWWHDMLTAEYEFLVNGWAFCLSDHVTMKRDPIQMFSLGLTIPASRAVRKIKKVSNITEFGRLFKLLIVHWHLIHVYS